MSFTFLACSHDEAMFPKCGGPVIAGFDSKCDRSFGEHAAFGE